MSTSKNVIDPALVRELASILREADLGEIEVEHESLRIRITKPQTGSMGVPALTNAPQSVMQVSASPAALPAGPASTPQTAGPVPENAVPSPMVGTAYLAPEPGAEAFVKSGDKVTAGQTLLLIEAMKTFNAVESPRTGIVKAILVDDAQPVEYGEPLIVVE